MEKKGVDLKDMKLHKTADNINKEFQDRNKRREKSILDELRPKTKGELTKLITGFHSKINLAEQFIEILPFYYDRGRLLWRWIDNRKCWKLSDEIDMLNLIEGCSYANIISTKERTEILNALKQVARRMKPKDVKKTWIQFSDEILDIETGKRIKASSDYFIVNPIPWNLGKSERTPTLDRVFKEWVGKDFVQTLYEIIAYCLLPDYPMARLFCFTGEGLNGKTSFLRVLRKFLGEENCVSTDLDLLLSSRFEITKLHKKLICQMGETNFNELNRTSILKRLTGQDLIGFEYKNKTPFDDVNYAKILIATNNLPTTTDKTIGFYRRWLIIDFPNKFSEKKDILKDIPDCEFENLASKSIKILDELLKKREFHNEGSVEKRKRIYEEKSNPLEKFWKDNCIEDLNAHVFKYEFREKLKDFCSAHRFRELSDNAISTFMHDKGVTSFQKYAEFWTKEGKKPRYWAWGGLKLRAKPLHSEEKKHRTDITGILPNLTQKPIVKN